LPSLLGVSFNTAHPSTETLAGGQDEQLQTNTAEPYTSATNSFLPTNGSVVGADKKP